MCAAFQHKWVGEKSRKSVEKLEWFFSFFLFGVCLFVFSFDTRLSLYHRVWCCDVSIWQAQQNWSWREPCFFFSLFISDKTTRQSFFFHFISLFFVKSPHVPLRTHAASWQRKHTRVMCPPSRADSEACRSLASRNVDFSLHQNCRAFLWQTLAAATPTLPADEDGRKNQEGIEVGKKTKTKKYLTELTWNQWGISDHCDIIKKSQLPGIPVLAKRRRRRKLWKAKPAKLPVVRDGFSSFPGTSLTYWRRLPPSENFVWRELCRTRGSEF